MIDLTKPLTTRDGRVVVITSIEPDSTFSLIGYVIDHNRDIPMHWTRSGRPAFGGPSSVLSLVEVDEAAGQKAQYAFYALSTISSDISPRRCSNAIAAKSESAIGKALKIKFENDLPVSVEIV